jgi:NAD(P)-dependent dehydrogenase (short-subunit alcohol dehydrogenase family)
MATDLSFQHMAGRVCVITGGGGIIGQALASGFAAVGVRMVIVDLVRENAEKLAASLKETYRTDALGVEGNVLDRASMDQALATINAKFGPVSMLINCAGGNSPKATTREEFVTPDNMGRLADTFYGLDVEGFRKVFDLNFLGTIIPTMVFTQGMVAAQSGAVLNVSSMNAFRPLTKIPAYSAAKASINNFTEWLAVHLAKVNIRVNGIAPGFFVTNQNRFLLFDEKTGELNARGKKIIAGTPMGNFGKPDDLQGAALFLMSDLATFITGVTIPVDGGFNAYSGV